MHCITYETITHTIASRSVPGSSTEGLFTFISHAGPIQRRVAFLQGSPLCVVCPPLPTAPGDAGRRHTFPGVSGIGRWGRR